MDITWMIELIVIIIVFFGRKYWVPMLKGTVILRMAKTFVSAANELYITKEIEDKAKEEAETKAREIVGTAIQRCAADHAAEVTVSVVSSGAEIVNPLSSPSLIR